MSNLYFSHGVDQITPITNLYELGEIELFTRLQSYHLAILIQFISTLLNTIYYYISLFDPNNVYLRYNHSIIGQMSQFYINEHDKINNNDNSKPHHQQTPFLSLSPPKQTIMGSAYNLFGDKIQFPAIYTHQIDSIINFTTTPKPSLESLQPIPKQSQLSSLLPYLISIRHCILQAYIWLIIVFIQRAIITAGPSNLFCIVPLIEMVYYLSTSIPSNHSPEQSSSMAANPTMKLIFSTPQQFKSLLRSEHIKSLPFIFLQSKELIRHHYHLSQHFQAFKLCKYY
jgi:hypothetical protein